MTYQPLFTLVHSLHQDLHFTGKPVIIFIAEILRKFTLIASRHNHRARVMHITIYGVHVVYIVALSLNIAAVWIFFSFQGLITRSAWTVSTPRWSHVFSLWYGPGKRLQLDSEMPITDLRKFKVRVRQKFVNNR